LVKITFSFTTPQKELGKDHFQFYHPAQRAW
jgi:hypothetical protein